MYQSMYTNTSSGKAIVGMVVVTFALTAVAIYTPAICEGIVKLAKSGKEKVTELTHKNKKPYHVCAIVNGVMYDTGETHWM